jgi:hypothetical protein
MWCPTCKAEVAAEVAADNRRVRCATCGGDIPVPATFPGIAKTREARELLERWASERQPDAAPLRGSGRAASAVRPVAGGGVSLEAEPPSNTARMEDRAHGSHSDGPQQESTTTARRIDAAQPIGGPIGAEIGRGQGGGYAAASHARVAARPESGRVHRVHGADLGGPNFDIQGSLLETDRRKTNWTYVLGQLLAYAGVALLTVGSTLVLWGYFGGPASYAPTGWLTTMAGQMILILGVVTLVTGGMEQTNEDVRVRIERIGERIVRIEQIAREQALRGPNMSADFARATADAGARQESEARL